jgi:hypothetical protein
MNIEAKATADRKKGTLTVEMDLSGDSELDHEILAAFFTSRSVTLTPTHFGDKLSARFVIADPNAFAVALHNLENRKRKADGRPTLEEESDQAGKTKGAQAAAEAAQKDRDAKAEKDRKDSQARIEAAAAKEIADRTLAKTEQAKQAKEPDKVQ